MGHGIGAAAMMAQMRTGLRAYALDGHTPAGVVERLNRLLLTLGQHQMTTLAYAVLDLERERATLVSAGHLPPLLRGPGGETVVLAVEGGPPLGVSSAATSARRGSTSRPAARCCGHRRRDRGARRRRGGRARASAGAVSRRPGISASCVRPSRRERCAARPPTTTWPCSARGWSSCPRRCRPPGPRRPRRWRRCARSCAAGWLGWGAAEDEIYDIIVAVQEACGERGRARVRAGRGGSTRWPRPARRRRSSFVVRDHGRWRSPRGTHRGRGILMMRALMETVDVTQDDDGTARGVAADAGRDAA